LCRKPDGRRRRVELPARFAPSCLHPVVEG
jgi:hypothetical protein